MSQEYNASAIKVLKGLEAVRKRPGMYIGDTGDLSGLHHMLFEVLDNSIDEALAGGYCDNIEIVLYRDGSASVKDNGRGMPADMHEQEQMPAAEVIMTQLHAGGKFSQDAYKISGGLHGVGVSVVNALSSWLKLTIWKDGYEYRMEFAQGQTVKKLEKIGPTQARGTMVHFLPDPTIFSQIVFDYDSLCVKFRELAFLNPGVKIVFEDQRDELVKNEFYDQGGVLSFAKYLAKNSAIIHETPVVFNGTRNDIEIDCAMVWTNKEEDNSLFFTNTIQQKDGGTHTIGFRSGLTRALQTYIKERGSKLHQKIEFSGEDIREGLTSVLSIKLPDASFSSQTKEKLVSSHVRQVIDSTIYKVVSDFLDRNPADAAIIVQKIIEAYNAKEAARRARALSKKKKGSEIMWQVSQKLAACSEKDPKKCELFIVEGDGAGGSAKQARNRINQAVLPLRGKILNTEKASLRRMLESEVISTLVGALGTGIGADFNLEKLRYHRIIIMTDADVDGKHIKCLLGVFIYKNLRKLIENGHVYVATPPLYGITEKHGIIYLTDEKDLIKYLMSRGLKSIGLKDVEGSPVLDVDQLLTFMLATNTIKDQLVAYPEMCRHAISAKFFTEESYGNLEVLRDFLSKKDGIEWKIKGSDLVKLENGIETQHTLDPTIISKRDKLGFIGFTKAWEKYWNTSTYLDKKFVLDPFQLLKDVMDKGKEGIIVQRFKGLGEMNPEQLRYAVMGSKDQRGEGKQRYVRLDMDKAIDMDSVCSILMGEEVAPRREFIMERAHLAQSD